MTAKFAKTVRLGGGIILFWVLLAGCDSTLFVRPGSHILRKEPAFAGNEGLPDGTLRGAIRSEPNQTLLGLKHRVYLYNLGSLIAIDSSWGKRVLHRVFDKDTLVENRLVEWLQTGIGEPPVLVEDLPLASDAENIEGVYFANGFLDAQVEAQVEELARNPFKADVTFRINEGPPYLLDSIGLQSTDTTMLRLIRTADSRSLLQPGNRYDQDAISAERLRIATILRDSGYFRMGPEQITYLADTTINPDPTAHYRSLLDTLQPADSLPPPNRDPQQVDPKRMNLTVVLPDTTGQYTIREVTIRVRGVDDPITANALGFDLLRLSPTVLKAYDIKPRWLRPEHNYTVITLPEIAKRLRLSTLARRMAISPGQLYSQALQRRTTQQLSALGLFRSVNLNYVVVDTVTNALEAYADLVLQRRYDLRAGIEASNINDVTVRSNYFGLGANLSLTDNNLLGRAEKLNLQLGGNVSLYRTPDGTERPFYTMNGRANLTIPSFLFIERPNRNLLRFRPNTSFSLSGLLESRREYNRATYNVDWTYTWFNTPYSNRGQFTLTPLALTYVQTNTTADFDDFLASFGADQRGLIAFIVRDLESRFLSRTALSYTYNNDYGVTRQRSSWFLRPGLEVGGLVPYLLDVAGAGPTNDSTLVIGNNSLQYGQYVRASLDTRLYTPIGTESALVSRIFLGYARGFGSSPFVPFEARFYTGGVSSVRGWLSNALGPGTIPQLGTTLSNVVALGGEIGFEANLEYRFPMVSLLEGALFMDAGNVWFDAQGDPDPRGVFSADNLEVGLAAGIGIRLDLTFLVIRLDLGQQLYAPDIRGWVVKEWPADIGSTRLQFNFGIGYPF